jgi:predicted nucleic acid-binding protein
MKSIVLVDTSIILEYLKTGKGILPTAYEKYQMWAPSTALVEIFASETFHDKSVKKDVEEFCEKYLTFKDVTKEVALVAADLVRNNKITFAKACLWALSYTEDIEVLVDSIKEEKEAKAAGIKVVLS